MTQTLRPQPKKRESIDETPQSSLTSVSDGD